jgi:hypothetical protein
MALAEPLDATQPSYITMKLPDATAVGKVIVFVPKVKARVEPDFWEGLANRFPPEGEKE